MSDETTTQAPETEVAEEQVSENETVQEDAEGIDPELLEKVKNIDPEVLKNIENLDEFYKRVNRKSMEAAELQKQAEAILATAQAKTGADDDDDVELDENAQRILNKVIEKKLRDELSPFIDTIVEERKDTEARIWEDFSSKHTDVDADKIVEKFYELGFDKTATTPAKYEAALQKAYKVAQAETVDIDAIVAQKVAEQLSSIKDGGGEVVSVKEKKSGIEPAPKGATDIVNDAELSWVDKLKILTSS